MTRKRATLYILCLLALIPALWGAAQCARPLAQAQKLRAQERTDAAADLNRQIAATGAR